MGNNKQPTEIATIDVAMVTVQCYNEDKVPSGDILCLTTNSKIEVELQTETTEAVKLIVKGVLKAQKKKKVTITGNKLKLTDNVFVPELVKILQGGTILYWQDAQKTSSGETPSDYGIAGYVPPAAGEIEKAVGFETCAYSAQYNAAGDIVQYEKITYPNCTGNPVAFNSEDGVFRAPEYEIDSAPDNGQPPYRIDYVKSLPEVGSQSA